MRVPAEVVLYAQNNSGHLLHTQKNKETQAEPNTEIGKAVKPVGSCKPKTSATASHSVGGDERFALATLILFQRRF